MNDELYRRLAAQLLCFTGAAMLLGWAGVQWIGIALVLLLGTAALWENILVHKSLDNLRFTVMATGVLSMLVWTFPLLSKAQRSTLNTYLDVYYSAVCWLVAAGLLLMRVPSALPGWFRKRNYVVFAWAILGIILWLAMAYNQNQMVSFFFALSCLLLALASCHLWFPPQKITRQVLNTLILLGFGVLLADVMVLPPASFQKHSNLRAGYSFEGARANPAAFAHWWAFYLQQWQETEKHITMADPESLLPCRLRPNSHATLLESDIHINSLGFRGKEIPRDKGDAYRIVTLGESTTFGITINVEDRPWPELLEELIAERLKPKRRVEVVNAGVPGYTILDSLHRLRGDILPLQPDLIIAYHGINGFSLLNTAFPATHGGSRVPVYQQRPLRLLANLEYRWKLERFRQSQTAALRKREPATLQNPMQTPCAKAFSQLIEAASTNHIPLALATFCMALDRNSSRRAIEFYQVAYPAARWCVDANEMQTHILEKLSGEDLNVLLCNTRPGLEGVHDNFLDLVHFSSRGDHQMAENLYRTLKPFLEDKLCR